MKNTNSSFIKGVKVNNKKIKTKRIQNYFVKKTNELLNSSFRIKKLKSQTPPHNQSEPKRRVWIVQGRVIKTDQNYVYVIFNDHFGICSWRYISDFHRRWKQLIKEQEVYNFLVVKQINSTIHFPDQNYQGKLWLLSYKAIHPEEIYNKSKPIPTSSHFQGLAKEFKEKPVVIAQMKPLKIYLDIAKQVKKYLKSEQQKIIFQSQKKSLLEISKDQNNKKIVDHSNWSLTQ